MFDPMDLSPPNTYGVLRDSRSGGRRADVLPDIAGAQQIGSGGAGTLYSDPSDPTRCIKVLKNAVVGERAQALHRLADISRWARPSAAEFLKTRFAWPLQIFGTGTAIEGYQMPLAPASAYFDLTVGRTTKRSLLQGKFLSDANYWQGAAISSAQPQVDLLDRLEIAIDLIDSFTALHDLDFWYGDVSTNNIAVRLDQPAGVFILDVDSVIPSSLFENQLTTPGWDVPGHLATFDIDRSKCAIFVVRLLLEDPRLVPSTDSLAVLPASVRQHIEKPLIQVYNDGGRQAFDDLSVGLRRCRSRDREARALDVALRSRFARAVMREADAAVTSGERSTVWKAEAQIAFELDVEAATGARFRTLLRRNESGQQTFRLDVRPRVEFVVAPQTNEELRQVIYEAKFEEIASHLSSVGLGNLESDPWLPRAVQHAMVEMALPTPALMLRPGEASLRVAWPARSWVNCARLRFVSGGDFQEEVIVRPTDDATLERVVNDDRSSDCSIEVCYGVRSRAGLQVFQPEAQAWRRDFTIPLPPRPEPNVRRPALSSAQAEQGPSRLLVDPVAEASRRAEAERQRKKRLYSQFAAAAVVFVLVITGGFLFIRGSDDQTTVRETLELEFTAQGMVLRWPPTRGDARAVAFDGSFDGVTWSSLLPLTDIAARRNRVLVSPEVFGDLPPMLRIGFVDRSGETDYDVWPDIRERGIIGYPSVRSTSGGLQLNWRTALTATGRWPQSYIVAYQREGTNIWYSSFTRTRNFVIPDVPKDTVVSVRVSAIFDSGPVGDPWELRVSA